MPAPASPSNRSSRQKNGRQKSGGGDRQKSGGNQGNNQLPKKVYMVDAVNVTGEVMRLITPSLSHTTLAGC